MNRRHVLMGAVVTVLLLVTGLAYAQGTAPEGETTTQAALGPGFTYQGRLSDGDGPVDDTCDLTFQLYDAPGSGTPPAGGTLLGTVVSPDRDIVGGVFTVELDFGSGAFDGDARWLQIAVDCGDGAVTLSPRQKLTPAPYALYAPAAGAVPWSGLSGIPADIADGDDDTTYSAGAGLSLTGGTFEVKFAGSGSANTVARSDHDHWGQSWTGTGIGLALYGDGSGMGAPWSNYGVYAWSTSTSGRGVVGYAAADSGSTSGVYGASDSTSGRGVFGHATATSGSASGVLGQSASTSGAGVYGYATANTGLTSGVRGASGSTDGRGVYGYATATSGSTSGVYGESASTGGRGVYGYASADTGTTHGLFGVSDSISGRGVYGHASADSGYTRGVYGKSDSTSGRGVFGVATATSGSTYGVYGESASTEGRGVYGSASGTSGTNGRPYGVEGYSSAGHGVYGRTSGDWSNISGVYGEADHDHANGVNGVNTAGGYGVRAESNTGVALAAKSAEGNLIEAWDTDPNPDRRWYVGNDGQVYADGSFNAGGADFAEMLPGAQESEPGDVLVVGSDGQLHRSSSPHDASVVGVYSTQPGFIGGSDEEMDNPGDVPLAVVGVVPVKASAENGAIAPGDLLTSSSTPGHAMRADANPPVGTVIGKALEGLDEGLGAVQMLVTLQ